MSAEAHLAYGLARHGQFDEATKMATAIEDEAKSASARILVARQLLEAGKLELAKALTLEAADLLAKQTDSSAEYHTWSLIRLLARMNQRERVMEIIDAAKSQLDKCNSKCGPETKSESRCHAVCKAAFDMCLGRCQRAKSKPKKRRRKP